MGKFGRAGLLCLIALAGCGGGSGGGDGGGSNPTISMALSPTSVNGKIYQSQTLSFTINVAAAVQGEINGTVYVVAVDQNGIFNALQLTPTDSTSLHYTANLTTSSNAAPGVYDTSLLIRACPNPSCSTEYGRTSLAYHIEITGNTNLTTLTPVPGATDWSGLQGNSGHTGFVPVTLDPSQFSPRWLFAIPEAVSYDTTVGPAASSDGKAYLPVNYNVSSKVPALFAVNEADGSAAWRFNANSASQVGAAATMPGRVYFQAYNKSSGSLWSLDSSNGATRFETIFGMTDTCTLYCNWIDSRGPVAAGQSVYANIFENSAESAAAYNAETGAKRWSFAPVSFPTVGSGYVYAYQESTSGSGINGLVVRDAASGNQLLSIRDADYFNQGGETIVHVNDTSHILVRTQGHLVNFDIVQQRVLWSTPSGGVQSTPNIGNGKVYYVDTNAIHAVDEAAGAVLWHWLPPAGSIEPEFIVTNNLMFVSTQTEVLAIDLETRETRWSYPHPGLLSMSSNGTLYIARKPLAGGGSHSDGYLAAINLH